MLSVAILLPHGCWDPSGPVMTHRFRYANDTTTPNAMFPAFLTNSFFSLFTFSAWILRFGSWNAVPKGPRLTQPIEEGSVRSCPSVSFNQNATSPLQQFLNAACPVPYPATWRPTLIHWFRKAGWIENWAHGVVCSIARYCCTKIHYFGLCILHPQ